MESGAASRTAVFVCQGRAVADGRLAVGWFTDPFAARLLTEDEMRPVVLARGGGSPADRREWFAVQSVAACGEVVAPRTVLIDGVVTQALERHSESQVVLLGAGLDARPWRLPALAAAPVLSVDHPASQADLRHRAERLPAPLCDLRYVAVDLTRETLSSPLLAAGHDPDRPTVWVWEGVIPYLSRPAIRETLDALTTASGPGSSLIAQYQTHSLVATLGRQTTALITRLSGVSSPLADEPWKSTWSADQMATLLAERGWTVDADLDLLGYSPRIGSPSRHRRSLANGHVVVARR